MTSSEGSRKERGCTCSVLTLHRQERGTLLVLEACLQQNPPDVIEVSHDKITWD